MLRTAECDYHISFSSSIKCLLILTLKRASLHSYYCTAHKAYKNTVHLLSLCLNYVTKDLWLGRILWQDLTNGKWHEIRNLRRCACSTCARDEKWIKHFNQTKRDGKIGDLEADGWLLLKQTLKKQCVISWNIIANKAYEWE